MKKSLTKVGNSWALLLNKTLIELLDINPETDQIEMEVENKVLKITKSKEIKG